MILTDPRSFLADAEVCGCVLALVVLDLVRFEGGNPSFAGFLTKKFLECGKIGILQTLAKSCLQTFKMVTSF